MEVIKHNLAQGRNATLGQIIASGLTLIEGDRLRIAGLSLTARAGEVIGLAGGSENEEGLCLGLLAGLIRPTFGVLRLCGTRVQDTPPPFLVGTNLAPPPADRRLTSGQWLGRLAAQAGCGAAEARSAQILDSLAMPGQAATRIGALSTQDRAVLGLGAAMAADPPVIIARQPFRDLERCRAELVRGLLRDWRAAGKAVLISADLDDLAEADCRRVYVIRNGQVMARSHLRDMRSITFASIGQNGEIW